jgi:hypothetical protein
MTNDFSHGHFFASSFTVTVTSHYIVVLTVNNVSRVRYEGLVMQNGDKVNSKLPISWRCLYMSATHCRYLPGKHSL